MPKNFHLDERDRVTIFDLRPDQIHSTVDGPDPAAIVLTNASINTRTSASVVASTAPDEESIFDRTKGISKESCPTSRASITFKVSSKAACPNRPSVDAVMSTVGFPLNSHDATVQSMAFFKLPGTPCAYSGVQMITPSAA